MRQVSMRETRHRPLHTENAVLRVLEDRTRCGASPSGNISVARKPLPVGSYADSRNPDVHRSSTLYSSAVRAPATNLSTALRAPTRVPSLRICP